MVSQIEFRLKPYLRGCHLITPEVLSNLPKLPNTGILTLFIKHTSAALSINENADTDVQIDLSASLDHIVKEHEHFYSHILEGDDDMPAHIKSSIIGTSITIPITNRHLNLGIWQGIYLCEFRNQGGSRNIIATIIGE